MPRILTTVGLLALVAGFLMLALPSLAHAEPDKAKAVELLGEGDKLLAKGDRYMNNGRVEKALAYYEDALKSYNAAYEAFPNPKIYFPIATAEQKLGRYLEAMRHYQEMIRGSENPSAELIEEVDNAIASVRKNLVALDLIVEQDGATVTVDGEVLGVTPLEGPYYMAPGEHKYSVTLEGHTAIEEQLDLAPGDVATRQVRLDALVVVKKKKPKKAVDVSLTSTTAPNKTPMTISFAAAGAFVLGATFTAIQAKARHDRFEDETLPVADRESARDSGKTYSLSTDILLGCALLSAGYGTYYYYATYKPAKKESVGLTARTLRVLPYADSEGAGVALGGSFW